MNTNTDSAPKPESLRPTLERLLDLAKANGAEACEAVGAYGRSLSISVRGGALEDIDNSEGRDIGLRVFVDGRQAAVSSSDLSDTALEKLAARCVAMARLAPKDKYCGLADKTLLAREAPDLYLFDETTPDADQLLRRAQELESAALSVKGVVQVEGAGAYMSQSAMWHVTSDGFSKGWRASSHGLSGAAFASDGTHMERDYDSRSARHFADLQSPERVGRKAARRAVARLGAQKPQSTTLPVIFERRVAAQLLAAFTNAVSGPAIARGVSWLKDKMEEQVFSGAITIFDDPHLVRGVGSHPWDSEGVACQKRVLVKDGVLQSWLLNTASARQLGLKSTGHASRALAGPAGVSASNCWIEPGPQTPEELMADIGDGLSVTEMFSPSLNPNTGDYSVGIAGFRIEAGAKTSPVNEVTIAGNLLDMFARLRAANDLVFEEALNAPSLLVDKMVIAGA